MSVESKKRRRAVRDAALGRYSVNDLRVATTKGRALERAVHARVLGRALLAHELHVAAQLGVPLGARRP